MQDWRSDVAVANTGSVEQSCGLQGPSDLPVLFPVGEQYPSLHPRSYQDAVLPLLPGHACCQAP